MKSEGDKRKGRKYSRPEYLILYLVIVMALLLGVSVGVGQAGILDLGILDLGSTDLDLGTADLNLGTLDLGSGDQYQGGLDLLGGLDMPSVPTGNPLDVGGLLGATGLGGATSQTGEIKALIPMPLDNSKKCEDCHNDRLALVTAMIDPVNNQKYPGLAIDVPYVDNFYVDPSYTSLPDSMMSKAKLQPAWDGCQTCHGNGDTFDPFPSDNWVPDSNPERGPQTAWAMGSTNNTSNSCGKCHTSVSEAFNKGIMGTHRGHLGAFNYNDVEIETTNVQSDFYFDPLGSRQAGTNGGAGGAGYAQSRESCSTCHQGCSDCHLTGPGDNPINDVASVADDFKPPVSEGLELIYVDQTHTTLAPRVKAYMATTLRRGGVSILEFRKGYIPGVSRGIPYTPLEAGMDINSHKMLKPTTAEQGNTMAPQTQDQSIRFCWRCHFRSGAEYQGQWINIVPNVNYGKETLSHYQAGMTCTDCHSEQELHGQTSNQNGVLSASFYGSTEAPDNPSHPGGNPRGTTPAWPITPNPVKVTCELCHTAEGKHEGPTGGQTLGELVTPRFQNEGKMVMGLAKMPVPGKDTNLSHSNVQCDVCHTQAQQNCWNCHIETPQEIGPLPGVDTGSALNLDVLPPIVNVREAEGEPVLSDRENALLKEAPARNDVATIDALLTFPQSVNTVNKAPRFMGRNNQGQVASMVHCPGGPPGINTQPYNNPQPLNLDGGLYITKSGQYGQNGSVGDPTYAANGSWYMEAGHSIARNPDGQGFTACYNCHADTVRMGKEPITYYRKNPWVMKSAGVPEALMPDSHYLDNRHKNSDNSFNCKCHSSDAIVHNGTEEGPFPGGHAGGDQYGSGGNAGGDEYGSEGSTSICAMPQLAYSVTRSYWQNYNEYQLRRLSVDFNINNNAGGASATDASVTGARNSNGVTTTTTMPVSVGGIQAGESQTATLQFAVPNGVSSFASTIYATAMDTCGSTYTYPSS